MSDERKHRGTGSPRGGSREGSGRKSGTKNALGYGQVKAIKAAGLRVPEDATKEQRELADECLGTMTEVMRGKIGFKQAPHRLKASTAIREEICGAVKQKLEHSGLDTLTDEQIQMRLATLLSKAATELPREAGQQATAVPKGGMDLGLEGNGEEP